MQPFKPTVAIHYEMYRNECYLLNEIADGVETGVIPYSEDLRDLIDNRIKIRDYHRDRIETFQRGEERAGQLANVIGTRSRRRRPVKK